MGVLVVHSSHDRAETFFRPGQASYSSKKVRKGRRYPNSTSSHLLFYSFIFLKMMNLPRPWLGDLITYVQDEAPVLCCVHLTGCFLCRAVKEWDLPLRGCQQRSSMAQTCSHFRYVSFAGRFILCASCRLVRNSKKPNSSWLVCFVRDWLRY